MKEIKSDTYKWSPEFELQIQCEKLGPTQLNTKHAFTDILRKFIELSTKLFMRSQKQSCEMAQTDVLKVNTVFLNGTRDIFINSPLPLQLNAGICLLLLLTSNNYPNEK